MTEPISCPALLIAAPASGQGKTTVTAALARLHTRQGRKVRVFKCGPDFLDPYWHTMASGAPVYQLDLWMTGEADCRARLAAAAREADLILVEGVMGLFDGSPSAADLARRLGLPILAVVDASAMAGTFGALAYGLQHYQADTVWAGILANRVASASHADMLKASLREPEHWLGAMMRSETVRLPERHLGLVVASEVKDAQARLDQAADALALTPLGQMTVAELARWNVSFAQPEPVLDQSTAPFARPLRGVTIAVAQDAAFCFIYAANLDCLRALGAELCFFSPLADPALPDCDAVWLPGGYPELHAPTLANNRSLRDSMRQHVAQGKPVWAECGGMMVLFDTLECVDGSRHPLWGLLPGSVTMHQRLVALGPQQWTLNPQAPNPEPLRGHTFHYSTTSTPLQEAGRTARPDCAPQAGVGEAVWHSGSVRASYFHAWFSSAPHGVVALFSPPSQPQSGHPVRQADESTP